MMPPGNVPPMAQRFAAVRGSWHPCGCTRRGNQGRLGLPPQAERAEGPPEGAVAPINRAKRTTRRGRSTPLRGPTEHGLAGCLAWVGRRTGVRNAWETGIGHTGA